MKTIKEAIEETASQAGLTLDDLRTALLPARPDEPLQEFMVTMDGAITGEALSKRLYEMYRKKALAQKLIHHVIIAFIGEKQS